MFVMRLISSWGPEGEVLRFDEPVWLHRFDPDGLDRGPYGGTVVATAMLEHAQRFPSFQAVIDEWMRPSTRVPLRPDGKENRPLTGFTIEPVSLSE